MHVMHITLIKNDNYRIALDKSIYAHIDREKVSVVTSKLLLIMHKIYS